MCLPIDAVGSSSIVQAVLELFSTQFRIEVGSGEVPRGEKILCTGTDPESYITEYN